MAAGGLSYQGLFPGRPWDSLSAIFAYGHFSDDLEGTTSYDQSYEVLLELNYQFQLAPWIMVKPDLQYVINPEGRSDIDDALVIGFAFGFTL